METWEQIVNNPKFIALPEIDRNKVRQGYFRDYIASNPKFQALSGRDKNKVMSGFLAEESKTQPKQPLFSGLKDYFKAVSGIKPSTPEQLAKIPGGYRSILKPKPKIESTPKQEAGMPIEDIASSLKNYESVIGTSGEKLKGLKSQLDAMSGGLQEYNSRVGAFGERLKGLKSQIDVMEDNLRKGVSTDIEGYKNLISQYNDLFPEYNMMIEKGAPEFEKYKTLSSQYNAMLPEFNENIRKSQELYGQYETKRKELLADKGQPSRFTQGIEQFAGLPEGTIAERFGKKPSVGQLFREAIFPPLMFKRPEMRTAFGITFEPFQRLLEHLPANVITSLQEKRGWQESPLSALYETLSSAVAPFSKIELEPNERKHLADVFRNYNKWLGEKTGVKYTKFDEPMAIVGGLGLRILMPDIFRTVSKIGRGYTKGAKADIWRAIDRKMEKVSPEKYIYPKQAPQVAKVSKQIGKEMARELKRPFVVPRGANIRVVHSQMPWLKLPQTEIVMPLTKGGIIDTATTPAKMFANSIRSFAKVNPTQTPEVIESATKIAPKLGEFVKNIISRIPTVAQPIIPPVAKGAEKPIIKKSFRIKYSPETGEQDLVATTKNLPPIEKGKIRLYRAENPNIRFEDIWPEGSVKGLPKEYNPKTDLFFSNELSIPTYFGATYGRGTEYYYIDVDPKSVNQFNDMEFLVNKSIIKAKVPEVKAEVAKPPYKTEEGKALWDNITAKDMRDDYKLIDKWIKQNTPKVSIHGAGGLKEVSEKIQRGEVPKNVMNAMARQFESTQDMETGEILDWSDEDYPRTGTLMNFYNAYENLDILAPEVAKPPGAKKLPAEGKVEKALTLAREIHKNPDPTIPKQKALIIEHANILRKFSPEEHEQYMKEIKSIVGENLPSEAKPSAGVELEPLAREARKYGTAEEFVGKMRGSATQFSDYASDVRKFGIGEQSKRISDLGINPEKEVTIYRGVSDVSGKAKRINDGDFVTTDFKQALAYTDSPENVVSKKVKAKDLIAQYPDEFKADVKKYGFVEAGQGELIYSDSKNPIINLTKSQLTDIWNKAQATKGVGKVAPAKKVVKKKPKVSKEPTTYRGLVLKRGGINPDKVKGIYNLKEDFWEFGIAGTLRKSSSQGLDELAQEMVSNNELFVPEDRMPGEYLLEQLQEKAVLAINDAGWKTDEEYSREYAEYQKEKAENEIDKRRLEAIRRNREKALEGEVAKERSKTINDAVSKKAEIEREAEKVRKGLTTKYGFGEIQRELPLGGQTDIFDFAKGKKEIKKYTAGLGGAGKIVSGEPEGERPFLKGKEEKIKFPTMGGRKLGKIYPEHLGPELVTKKLRKWEGLFKYPPTPNGKIAMRKLANLKGLAHETGHFIDLLVGKYPVSRSGPVRDELIALTKAMCPFEERYKYGISKKTGKPTKHLDSYSVYRRSRQELFADYISAYATDPVLAKKLAPQFTDMIEKEIASGTNSGKAIDYVVKKIHEFNEEFDPLIDYVDSLRKIPEFRKEIEKSFEKGNALQMFYRRHIGDKLWNLLSKKLDKAGQAKFIKGLFEKGGVPDPVFFATKERLRLMHGQVAKLQDELIEPLRTFSPEDKLFVAKSLQNFRINKEDTPIKKLTETARKELALWGNEAKKLGLLNDMVFWNNVGQYYPYFYSTKEFADNIAKFGSTAKAVRVNLKSFKHRLTDEELVLKGLKAHYGTWPSQLKKVEAEMSAMSPEDIKLKAAEIREKMGLIEKNPEYSLYKRIYALIQSVYTTKCLNNIATMPGIVGKANQEGYLRMSESASSGALSGQWVERNTAEMINEWDAQSDEYMKVIETVTQIWKALKVPYNPAAVSRNIVSNFLLQYMIGDVPIWKPIYAARGIKSFTTKDKVYKLLRDNGLYKQTYAAKEMEVLAGKEGSLSGVAEWAVKTFNTPGKVYGAIEDIGKTMIARYVIDNGGTTGQAVDLAQKCLFDYSNVSYLTNKARKFPIPFITFSAKVFPRLVEVAVRKPEKYIIMLLLLTAIEEYSRQRLKISRGTVEAVKPSYLRGGQFANPYILLPEKDKNGEMQFIDLSYFVPWGGWTQMQRKAEWIPQPLQIGNPFIMAYNAYVLGFDPFSGREISPNYLTLAEQTAARHRYFRRGILPDLLGGRATERLIRVYKSELDYYGRKPDWKREVLRDLTGVNIVLGGEKTTGVSNWKSEKAREDIERKRPAKLAVERWIREGTLKAETRAREMLKPLTDDEKERILRVVIKDYIRQKSGMPSFLKLSEKKKIEYLQYLKKMKEKVK